LWLGLERIADHATFLNFRRRLNKHELAGGIMGVLNGYPGNPGLSLRQGTLVDAGYTWVEKRPEQDGRKLIWQVAARRNTDNKLDNRSVLYKAARKIKKAQGALWQFGEKHCTSGERLSAGLMTQSKLPEYCRSQYAGGDRGQRFFH
jgi:IS5 family transposase